MSTYIDIEVSIDRLRNSHAALSRACDGQPTSQPLRFALARVLRAVETEIGPSSAYAFAAEALQKEFAVPEDPAPERGEPRMIVPPGRVQEYMKRTRELADQTVTIRAPKFLRGDDKRFMVKPELTSSELYLLEWLIPIDGEDDWSAQVAS
jgi:hypothetical protein